MTRIFLQNHKFHKILPSSFHEGEFEHIITLQAPDLYPDYYVIPFKKTVISPSGESKPDLVFIAKDYKDWYIVEVEMAYHNYNTHVEPQLHRIATAKYDEPEVAKYMSQQCCHLDLALTMKLIRNEPAKILLILNEMMEEWANDLSNKYGVITSIFEIFHHSNSSSQTLPPYRAYGIERNYPVYSVTITTTCSVHPFLAWLQIDNNSSLQIKPGNQIMLEYDNCVTFWRSIEGPNKSIWLQPDGRNALVNKRKNYHIAKLRDDSLILNVA